MSNNRIVVFRLGNQQYGTISAAVGGMTSQVQDVQALRSNCIPVIKIQTELTDSAGQQALLLNSHGLQVALLVDEVIKVEDLQGTEPVQEPAGIFRIWRISE
ncbi:hypothetical protein [Propionispora vibrioides]|jgi:hypothetical protein|uniref:CheW-like domain-containing protein n=1 Tax=Propionispora vibrioides TaxID=112903 RepID=A0A1H8U2S2_9FIRM|nr:hypothetical protein [Propionispora vibrioides]SEO97451.1 hypothetical protein SAMN04490178_1087 [Propionispora vibrioides]